LGCFYAIITYFMADKYRTIAHLTTGEYKEKGSKFIAYAYPINADSEVKTHIDALKLEHHKARHWCYAWRIGLDANRYRANDDGEPGGTAGRPILGQIDSFALTNVLIVVVRYFGGTKLGTSGLIQAYKESAQEALNQAVILEKRVEENLEITCEYPAVTPVLNALKRSEGRVIEQDFSQNIRFIFAVPQDDLPAFTAALCDIDSVMLVVR
jgi:uncharacterized YigZ family protein